MSEQIHIRPPCSDTKFDDALRAFLLERVEKVTKEQIAIAQAEIDRQLREVVGTAVIGLLRYYSIEKHGSDLVITVKNQFGEKGGRP